MKYVRNIAVGAVTVATLGTVTAAMAAQPLGSYGAGSFERPELDPEKKAQFQEIREAVKAGDMDLAEQLKEEYGLEDFGFRGKMDPEKREEMKARREAVKEALSNGDYDAFVEAHGDKGVPEEMTEEKFGQVVEVFELKEAGDLEGAKALAEEYGLKRPGHFKKGFMKRGMMKKWAEKAGEEFGEDAGN